MGKYESDKSIQTMDKFAVDFKLTFGNLLVGWWTNQLLCHSQSNLNYLHWLASPVLVHTDIKYLVLLYKDIHDGHKQQSEVFLGKGDY